MYRLRPHALTQPNMKIRSRTLAGKFSIPHASCSEAYVSLQFVAWSEGGGVPAIALTVRSNRLLACIRRVTTSVW